MSSIQGFHRCAESSRVVLETERFANETEGDPSCAKLQSLMVEVRDRSGIRNEEKHTRPCQQRDPTTAGEALREEVS
jgi:hypothetical protein